MKDSRHVPRASLLSLFFPRFSTFLDLGEPWEPQPEEDGDSEDSTKPSHTSSAQLTLPVSPCACMAFIVSCLFVRIMRLSLMTLVRKGLCFFWYRRKGTPFALTSLGIDRTRLMAGEKRGRGRVSRSFWASGMRSGLICRD